MWQSLIDLRKQLAEKNAVIDNMKIKTKDFVQSLHNGDFIFLLICYNLNS